jgi:hypothetical protein
VNLHRRHLNESQRAMIAGRLANREGPGRPEKNSLDLGNFTAGQAAELLNVSQASVENAKSILREAPDDALAKNGELGRGRNRCDASQLVRGSNGRAYHAARLKRDRPDLARKVENKEMSLRQAAIAAGIVKVPTPIDRLIKDWKLAPPRKNAPNFWPRFKSRRKMRRIWLIRRPDEVGLTLWWGELVKRWKQSCGLDTGLLLVLGNGSRERFPPPRPDG